MAAGSSHQGVLKVASVVAPRRRRRQHYQSTVFRSSLCFRLSNQDTVPPSRFSLPARSQPTERIAPMRKFLGKLGGAFRGPFLHAATLLLLISATICHAQAPDCYLGDYGGFNELPTISSVTPSVWNPGQTYTVAIWGSWEPVTPAGCTSDLVTIYENSSYPSFPHTNVDPYVTITNITYVSATETDFTVKVAANAPTENDSIDIFCSGPGCGNWDDVRYGIVIQPAPPPPPCSVPTISSISPNVWPTGKQTPVTITGTGFTTTSAATAACPVSTVTVTTPSGAVVALGAVTVVDPTQITIATVAPPASETTETATVTVSGNPAYSAMVQVVNKPTITSISPSAIYVGKDDVQVTISGSGFGTSPTVNLPTGVTSSDQTSSDSQIVLTMSVGYVTPTTSAKVTVTNDDNNLTSNQVTITLNGPAYGKVLSDIFAYLMPGQRKARVVQYQVFNIDKTVAANIPIAEDFSATGWNCKIPSKQPTTETTSCDGSTVTESDGNFPYPDDWTWYAGDTPKGCGANITDHWQWCSPSGPTTGITFMTLKGFIHTNATEINGNIQPPSDGMMMGTIIGP